MRAYACECAMHIVHVLWVVAMRESSNVTAAIHIARDVVQYVAAKVLEVTPKIVAVVLELTRKMTLLLSNVTRPPPPLTLHAKRWTKLYLRNKFLRRGFLVQELSFRQEKSTQLCREILITSSTAIRNAMHNNLTRNETKTSDRERT